MSEDRKIVKKVFGDVADKYGWIPGGPALIYLIRRFGHTGWGGDDHKEVCVYYLPTEMAGLQVRISIKASRAQISSDMEDDAVGTLYWQYQTEEARPSRLVCRLVS